MSKLYILGSIILFVWALVFFAALTADPNQICDTTYSSSRTFKLFVFGGPIIGVALKWLGKNPNQIG